jgi:hypothetical protein
MAIPFSRERFRNESAFTLFTRKVIHIYIHKRIIPSSASLGNSQNMSFLRKNTKSSPPKPTTDTSEHQMRADIANLNSLAIRYTKFKTMLDLPHIDLGILYFYIYIEQLRKLSWPGIPEEIRPTVWKLLFGYLPVNSDRRESTLERKRKEYHDYIQQTFGNGIETLDAALLHQVSFFLRLTLQIRIDIQRTNASIPLYQSPVTQTVF